MPSLLSDKAAQWVRENMDSGNWRSVPRRINHAASATGGGDGGCFLATVNAYTGKVGVFTATVWTFTSGSSAEGKTVLVHCPTMNGLTRIGAGDVIVVHKCQMDEYDGEESGA